MEKVVDLRPGDKVNVICNGTHVTPFGTKSQETTVQLSYEEILEKFQTVEKPATPRKRNPAAAFSRFAHQVSMAVASGKWTNGADINRDDLFESLKTRFTNLDPVHHATVTPNGIKALGELYVSAHLKSKQKKEVKEITDAVAKAQAGDETAAAV